VIAEETDLILVGLENLLRAQKSGVLYGWFKLG
jgi:hypothetical protein